MLAAGSRRGFLLSYEIRIAVRLRDIHGGCLLSYRQADSEWTVSVTSVKITNSRNRVLCTIVPHGFPVTRYIVKKEADDESVVEYIQVSNIIG